MLDKALINRINSLLDAYAFKDKNNLYYSQIYASSYDQLSNTDILLIGRAAYPRLAFEEILMNIYATEEYDSLEALLDKIVQDEKISYAIESSITSCDEIRAYLWNNFYVLLPEYHYLQQTICVNITLDCGDANYDYVINQPFASWNSHEFSGVDDESSLLWLSCQQGYKKRKLTSALRDLQWGNSTFLRSVYDEVSNVTSRCNAVTFFVQMTLEEYFNLREALSKESSLNDSYNLLERKGTGFIVIDKKTTCGLYDSYVGAGGLLEITLEHDVKLPIKCIGSAYPDGVMGYSVEDIWGCSQSLWTSNGIKKIIPMM